MNERGTSQAANADVGNSKVAHLSTGSISIVALPPYVAPLMLSVKVYFPMTYIGQTTIIWG
ncbi:hypothetical protein P154DRAFT_524067 [Amniculicola lignicola CBS 123094]|uniref:Uncharacterized protein n=1 Tax=Amniculicola lignicola CBS 123094 TaxID=1392246 RepID=A0A6A5WB64_9PLEO|nr:hypothetical protein P154DRAFT_524067 [Amniculicola lignicola CBS 123094]